MKKIFGLIVLLGWGIVEKVKAQKPSTDSLQKGSANLRILADSLRKDTLRLASAQTLDSLSKKATLILNPPKHNPKKAVIYSALLPGLGQAYNKQYWKIPLVYGGLGTVVFFFRFYNVRYQDFVKPYVESYDPNTGRQLRSEAPVFLRGQNRTTTLSIDQITKGKDFYRRYRDLNIILIAAVWALNVVEANVSAHLKTFDVSEDISLRWQPDIQNHHFTGNTIGAKITLALK
ncbi:MAG: DUF5683 domain-containing protein [Runella sp.]